MTAVAARTPSTGADRAVTVRWISGPVVDVLIALSWVPFSVAAIAWHGHLDQLASLMAATFLLSLSHQPLTLALVYGDPGQFRLRRRLFTWSPVIFLVAILIGTHVALLAVAAVAGLWNAEHTLLQRYGLTRIYGRKAGQDDGRTERLLLHSWLVVALAWAAADPGTPGRIAGLPIGGTNQRSIHLLTSARPVATAVLVVAGAASIALMARWVVEERRRPAVNPAKYLYLGTTLALFATVLVDPVAGLLGYVGAHAIEYLLIVHRHVGTRYVGDGADDGGAVGRTVRSPLGRTGFVVGYLMVTLGAFTLLRHHASATTYSVVFLTAGGLHVFYDGFIWKLRRPSVARGFALASPAPPPPG